MSSPPAKRRKVCHKATSTVSQMLCFICKKPPRAGSFTRYLICGHPVHTSCLRKWRKLLCPVCIMEGGNHTSEDDEDGSDGDGDAARIVDRIQRTFESLQENESGNSSASSRHDVESDVSNDSSILDLSHIDTEERAGNNAKLDGEASTSTLVLEKREIHEENSSSTDVTEDKPAIQGAEEFIVETHTQDEISEELVPVTNLRPSPLNDSYQSFMNVTNQWFSTIVEESFFINFTRAFLVLASVYLLDFIYHLFV